MPRKPKSPQIESPNEISGRDLFQTPDYATKIVVPYFYRLMEINKIWECASGLGIMARRLRKYGFDVIETDLSYETSFNFLTDKPSFEFDAIVTNPPFSIKKKFFLKCIEYGRPFALLVPADYSGWTIEAVDKYGCEKIIPSRRIDYITPNILRRIWEGEAFERMEIKTCSLEEYKRSCGPIVWDRILDRYSKWFKFPTVYDVPQVLLRKYSSSYYHSMWLTRGLGLKKSETFVDLTNEEKEDIIS